MNSSGFISFLSTFLRENILIVILSCIGFIFLGYGLIGFLSPQSTGEEIVISEPEDVGVGGSFVTVDVSGAVNKPGVYTLPSNSRVNEAVKEAGGLSVEADHAVVSRTINFAKLLTDGEKIYVPTQSEVVEENVLGVETAKISINTATGTELDSLPGVGPVTAEKIINGRPYSTIDDLLSKKVVGQSVFGEIKDQISL